MAKFWGRSDARSPIPPIEGGDRTLQMQMERLHRVNVLIFWVVVATLWLGTLPIGLWVLRRDIQLLLDVFTWTALRYALAFQPLLAIALSLCIGLTLGVLVWQSRNILLGMSARDVRRLRRQVERIRAAGPRHPLWRWVCKP